MNKNRFIVVLLLGMAYATLYMICSVIFFRYISVNLSIFHYHAKFSGSCLLYPCMFITSDIIVMLTNRKVGITIALLGLLCEGIFAFNFGMTGRLITPTFIDNNSITSSEMIGYLGNHIWLFFCYGVFAETAAAIGEIIIFSSVFNKLRTFTTSTIFSIAITFVIHNTIKDYLALGHEPDVWNIIITNTLIDIGVMATYVFVISSLIKINAYSRIRNFRVLSYKLFI